MRNFLLLVLAVLVLSSCQFTETMVLQEDGSGRMSIEMDMSEMLAFGMDTDSAVVKMDSILVMKDILEEKKDSIAKLPEEEQRKLKMLENYSLRMQMDTEAGVMIMNIFTDFKDVSEANDLMNGLEKSNGMMPGMGVSKSKEEDQEEEKEVLGVAYSYKKGKFKRDAYIKDKEAHQKQLDSLKQAESFMSSMRYKLKYTFPRKIKKASVEDATYSIDGKTIEFERSFIDFFKDPDLLDLEVELEDK